MPVQSLWITGVDKVTALWGIKNSGVRSRGLRGSLPLEAAL